MNKIKLVGIAMILVIAGCKEKDELTLPVKVGFEIGLIYPQTDYLFFSEGHIGIQSIQFDGKREAGEDIFFETDPETNFPTIEFRRPSLISFFDIPQGIYDYMKWDIDLKKIEIDEYPDSQSKGLVLSGSYVTCEGWCWTPWIIAVDDIEQFSVRACDPYGNSTIVLTGDKNYKARLYLDLSYVFNSISQQSLDEADILNVNGEPTIVISSEINKDLYENILYRLTQSAKILVL